jgi:hypothetical protein
MATKPNRRKRSANSPSPPPAKRRKIMKVPAVAPFAATFPRRTLLSSSRWVNKVPHDIWVHQILHPFLDLKALSTVGRCNTFFEEYWQHALKKNVIRVPEGCPTVNQALDLAVIFSERNECTRANPVKVELGDGEHVLGNTHVRCNNITIVGKGKDQTTIRGGFRVENQQNVTFEELTITEQNGNGLMLQGSETNVDVLKCVVKECGSSAMCVRGGATATATQCEFMENGGSGVYCGSDTKVRLDNCKMHHNGNYGLLAWEHAVVDLHGTTTDVHSNKLYGIVAVGHGKINIHLPSQHSTSHDNVGEDRIQWSDGSIANINADGTFTHVEL